METDNKLASNLQDRLVQCCIDYIKETGNMNIESVRFSVNGLQWSAECGGWHPGTDSACTIENSQNEVISFSI